MMTTQAHSPCCCCHAWDLQSPCMAMMTTHTEGHHRTMTTCPEPLCDDWCAGPPHDDKYACTVPSCRHEGTHTGLLCNNDQVHTGPLHEATAWVQASAKQGLEPLCDDGHMCTGPPCDNDY